MEQKQLIELKEKTMFLTALIVLLVFALFLVIPQIVEHIIIHRSNDL